MSARGAAVHARADYAHRAQQITRALHAGPLSAAQLAQRLGLGETTVSACLTALKADGLVQQPRRGLWALVIPNTH